MAASEVGPRRRKRGVEIETLLVEVARLDHALVGTRQLVGAQVQLIGMGVVRRVGCVRRDAGQR